MESVELEEGRDLNSTDRKDIEDKVGRAKGLEMCGDDMGCVGLIRCSERRENLVLFDSNKTPKRNGFIEGKTDLTHSFRAFPPWLVGTIDQ